jgi:hypothetical protein
MMWRRAIKGIYIGVSESAATMLLALRLVSQAPSWYPQWPALRTASQGERQHDAGLAQLGKPLVASRALDGNPGRAGVVAAILPLPARPVDVARRSGVDHQRHSQQLHPPAGTAFFRRGRPASLSLDRKTRHLGPGRRHLCVSSAGRATGRSAGGSSCARSWHPYSFSWPTRAAFSAAASWLPSYRPWHATDDRESSWATAC